jgi:hypothetical protein
MDFIECALSLVNNELDELNGIIGIIRSLKNLSEKMWLYMTGDAGINLLR